jgi:hypothetical protein
MTSSLRYAAVALCVGLAFTACTKSTQTTSTTSDTTQTTAPDAGTAGASAAPAANATSAGEATTATTPAASATMGAMAPASAVPTANVTTGGTTSGSANGTSGAYIDLPVYTNATEMKDQDMSASSNTGSVVMKAYTTKDDAKTVADWYRSRLPSAWKGGVLTAGSKTVGTFSNEESDGDQSVIVASQDDGTTRIQLTTKHGK